MKILAISDAVEPFLYGASLSSYASGVGAVVSCGDLPFEYLEYVVTFSGAPLYYVRGNHDPHESAKAPGAASPSTGAWWTRGRRGVGRPLRVALVRRGAEPAHRARHAPPGVRAVGEDLAARSCG